MKLSRRSFLAAAGLGAVNASLPDFVRAETGSKPGNLFAINESASLKGRLKLAVSTYSYRRFNNDPGGVEEVIDKAAGLGVEGVDILHRNMSSEDNSYCQQLKKRAFLNGVDLVCLSIHQDFVDPNPEYRQRMVDHTIRCIELAYKLGIPSIRLNSGTWGTTGSFDELMKARGIEPLIEGYTENDGFGWVTDCIYKCLPAAERCGVILALENHWGIAGTPEGMIRIKKSVNSEWLKFLVDTGNFLEEPYDKLALVLPDAAFISAKTYQGGGMWYTLDLNYDRIVKQIHDVGYRGYLTLEFEGKEEPETAVPDSLKMLKGYIDKHYANVPVR
ncbi:MAG: sugar phosphate isomerase/epimerase [Tannerella sp.]|jgi:sugar phosphate isomerase/epimerase|nr:sugar phosphate isomerase/epimerase [Tannerella sp.]